MEVSVPKLKTNLNTNFLKVIAIISMFIDHIGGEFFPQYPIFRWIGRLAFPLFCYCMTVGMLYTSDIKKYLGRLLIFAFISQPFYGLAFGIKIFDVNSLNIYFTLFMSLLTVWGFKEKKWLLFAVGILILSFINFDYSLTGVVLMMIFYLCRNKPALGAMLYVLNFSQSLFFSNVGDVTNLVVGNYEINFMIFAVLAAPLIFLKTNVNIKLPKWFFYWFYPVHLLLIYIVKLVLKMI